MLVKTTLREIKCSLGRYLAIFAIIALGVGFFAGLRMCRDAMVDTANDYLKEHNLYDYEIQTTYGIDDNSVKLAQGQNGVAQAEGSIQHDIMATYSSDQTGQALVLKAISIPENINTLKLCEGRLPEKDNECVIDNYKGPNKGHDIGDTIKIAEINKEEDLDYFKYKEYKIVGKVNTPLYLDYERGTTKLSDGSLNTFFYIKKEGFDTEYFTNLYIKLEGNEYIYSEELDDKLSKYKAPMEELGDEIAADRFNREKNEAQSTLDDNRAEYDRGAAKLRTEKNSANKKLKNARSKINSGKKEIAKNEQALKSKYKEASSAKKQLEQAHDAGLISDEEFNAKIKEINAGIEQIEQGLAVIKQKKSELDKNEAVVNSQEKKANKEFAKADKKLESAKMELDDAQAEIDSLEKAKAYSFSREDNQGYATFEENANIVSNIAKIFPLFFFLVAALVCMTTMSRMIDEQRSQMGVLRALGYSNTIVLAKYLAYAGSASLCGSVVGFFIGCKVFPMVIWNAYTMMYNFNPDINYIVDWKLGAISVGASLLCAMGATWVSCGQEFKEMPANLIRPKAPPEGKRILLERITPIWNRLSFLYKVSFRNVFRYKKRFIMMVLGICGCTALLVAGIGINTSIRDVAKHQYEEVVVYDYQIIFDKSMSDSEQTKFIKATEANVGDYGKLEFVHQGAANMKIDGKNREITLITSRNDISNYHQFRYKGEVVLTPGEGEVLVCRKLHDQQDLNIGDKVVVNEDGREMTASVAGFYDNYVEETIYMTEAAYIKGMGAKPDIKTAFVLAPANMNDSKLRQLATDVAQHDDVAATVVNQDVIDRVEKMMESLNAVVYVVIFCAGLLAFIVLYNLTNINILERIREIATIKVLGFNQSETAQYVFRENVFLTGIAALIGLPMGKWLLDFVMDNIRIKMIFFVTRITTLNYLCAFLLTFVFAFIVNLAMRPRLNKISMTESLKSIE